MHEVKILISKNGLKEVFIDNQMVYATEVTLHISGTDELVSIELPARVIYEDHRS